MSVMPWRAQQLDLVLGERTAADIDERLRSPPRSAGRRRVARPPARIATGRLIRTAPSVPSKSNRNRTSSRPGLSPSRRAAGGDPRQ